MARRGFIKRPDVPESFKTSPWWAQAPEGYEDKDDGKRWWYRLSIFAGDREPWKRDPDTRGGEVIEKPTVELPAGFADLFGERPDTKDFGGATSDYRRVLDEWERWLRLFKQKGVPENAEPASITEAREVVGSWGMGALEFFQTIRGDWWAIFPEVDFRMRPYMERPAALTRELGRTGDAFSPDNIVADYHEQLWKRLGVVAPILHPFVPPELLAEIVGDDVDNDAIESIVKKGPRTDRGENWADVLRRGNDELRRQAERRAG